MIYIVGLGPGNKDYILPKAISVLKQSHIVLGFKRALDSLDIEEDKKLYMKKLRDLDKYILKNCNEEDFAESTEIAISDLKNLNKTLNEEINISIVASGDPTFYGITNYIKKKAEVDFEVVPGISSFQYLTSKIKLPWNNAYLGSLHGRCEEFLDIVSKHELSIWLTDKENNPAFLCELLDKEEIKCRVIIGENLSYEDEIINEGSPNQFVNYEFSQLSVFIIERD